MIKLTILYLSYKIDLSPAISFKFECDMINMSLII